MPCHSHLFLLLSILIKRIQKTLTWSRYLWKSSWSFKGFNFVQTLELAVLLRVSYRWMHRPVSSLALNHSFSTNPLTSKVNLVYNPYSWAPRRFMPRWFGIIPNNRANKIHANRCSEKSIRIRKEIKVKQGILRRIVTEITSLPLISPVT